MSELSNKLAVKIFEELYDDEDLKELEQKKFIRQALGFKLSTIAIIECEIEEQLQQLQQDKAELEESISYYKNKIKNLEFMVENGLGWEDMKGGNIEDVM